MTPNEQHLERNVVEALDLLRTGRFAGLAEDHDVTPEAFAAAAIVEMCRQAFERMEPCRDSCASVMPPFPCDACEAEAARPVPRMDKVERVRREIANEGARRYVEARAGAVDHGRVIRDMALERRAREALDRHGFEAEHGDKPGGGGE